MRDRYPFDRSWLTLLHDLDVSVPEVLHAAGLPPDLPTRTTISTAEFVRFWNVLEARVGDPAFALRIAERITAEALVPPLFAALCSENLDAAVVRMIEYKQLMGPGGFSFTRSAKGLRVRAVSPKSQGPLPHSLLVAELSTLVRIARMGSRVRITPTRLVSRVPLRPVSAYRRFFGVVPEHGREDAVVFTREDAERPFITGNDEVWSAFEPKLRARLRALGEGVSASERVRAVLLERIPAGDASVDAVARRLGVGRRTLQRQLSEDGASFQALLAATRSELARHYLAATELTVTEIGFLLGFDQPRSFFRAFQRWTGTTPRRFRERS